MAPIHVDEATGSDETGKGTPEAPYQSLAFALYTHPDGAFQIRKDASTPYDEPTQSALKKAKRIDDAGMWKRVKTLEEAQRKVWTNIARRDIVKVRRGGFCCCW